MHNFHRPFPSFFLSSFLEFYLNKISILRDFWRKINSEYIKTNEKIISTYYQRRKQHFIVKY